MQSEKHFIAIHNETGERIDFDLENIQAIDQQIFKDDIFCGTRPRIGFFDCVDGADFLTTKSYFVELFEEYTFYYSHQGKYYNYETQEEMG